MVARDLAEQNKFQVHYQRKAMSLSFGSDPVSY